ncbi:MAG TPA: histidine ammonia-lyase [Candidatus Thermoplasmatota archaeon]|nr:histidine ammonia-lyase [Candidatus Thermoplasmatota archaeon]
MSRRIAVDGESLSIEDVVAVARAGAVPVLADAARRRLGASRAVVERFLGKGESSYGLTSGDKVGRVKVAVDALEEEGRVAYGITTGFGELARVHIPPSKVRELQLNLVRSHACGVGEPFADDVVRAVLLLRANALAKGLSGVRVAVVETLLGLLEKGVTPVVPSRGSLGASGDLVPLAHVALVLVGEGEARYRGETLPGAEALRRAGLAPLVLEAKEGLALINGTQFMAALLALSVADGLSLVRNAELAGAMSLEVLLGSERPFDPRVADARPHAGQRASAENLRKLVAGSPLIASHEGCHRVQDAYSLRCMPQVFGAVRGVLAHAREVLAVEMNSATDNPLVFPDGGDEVVSNGNFHGEPLALLASYLATAFSEIAAMSERRTARLVDPRLSEGLPAFLARDPGLSSGLMIPQYVAVALALETQANAFPAVLLNAPTSANQEDHNSNGLVGSLQARAALDRARLVVAIELVTAAEAADLRAPLALAPATGAAHAALRAVVPPLDRDRVLAHDLLAAARLVEDGSLVSAAEARTGPLH